MVRLKPHQSTVVKLSFQLQAGVESLNNIIVDWEILLSVTLKF